MSVDALTLISKIVDRAAQKCGQSLPAAAIALDDDQRTDLLVETLAGQLVGFLGLGESQDRPAAVETSELERICADQIARNQSLARALGACDCWGELASCEVCAGRGAPGWRPPHMPSFNVFVRPVVQRMNQRRPTARGWHGVHYSRPSM
jgi:hypothetical protein